MMASSYSDRAGALLIAGGRVVDPARGWDGVADVLVSDGVIRAVTPSADAAGWDGELRAAAAGSDGGLRVSADGELRSLDSGGLRAAAAGSDGGVRVLDARGLVVTPGFVDIHTHLREPGFEYKETIATGAAAAARGGFTTICAMPNTEPPVDNAAVVDYIRRRAAEAAPVRVQVIGCVTRGRAGRELADLEELASAGAVAFSDDGDPVYDAGLMRLALTYGRDLGVPISNHCQEHSLCAGGVMAEGWVSSRLGLPGIPAVAEEAMVARDIGLAELTGGRLHLAHLSTAGSVALVRQAKARGVAVTAEVCPHHLALTEEWALGGKGAAGGESGVGGISIGGSGVGIGGVGGVGVGVGGIDRGTGIGGVGGRSIGVGVGGIDGGTGIGSVGGIGGGVGVGIGGVGGVGGGVGGIGGISGAAFYDTATKVYPPLRSAGDVAACVAGLADGTIDCVATDHAPHERVSKECTYEEAAFGISVLETALGTLLAVVRGGGISLATMVERLTAGPARVLGAGFASYGSLAPGTPADITVFDPAARWTVDAARFASLGRNTPLDGVELQGRVAATLVGGRIVFEEPALLPAGGLAQ